MVTVCLSQVFLNYFFSLVVLLMEGFKGSRNKHLKPGSSSYKDTVFWNFWHLFFLVYTIEVFWCQSLIAGIFIRLRRFWNLSCTVLQRVWFPISFSWCRIILLCKEVVLLCTPDSSFPTRSNDQADMRAVSSAFVDPAGNFSFWGGVIFQSV